MNYKSIIAGVLGALLLAPAVALAAQELDIYYPESNETFVMGTEYKVRFTMEGGPDTFTAGAVFARRSVGAQQAFRGMVETAVTSKPTSYGGSERSHSIEVTANEGFGITGEGDYNLWVFACGTNGRMIASGSLPVKVSGIKTTTNEGWFTENGSKYYGRDGSLLTGWQDFGVISLSRQRYYFDEEGVMQTGWLNSDNKWYYLNGDGRMSIGWTEVAGESYFFDPLSGYMYTNWRRINNRWHYFAPDGGAGQAGRMQTGWVEQGGKSYYLDAGGGLMPGWQQVDGKWYYFRPFEGSMYEGMRIADGAIYFEYPNGGEQMTGWQEIGADSCWYYLLDDGGYATGWLTIGNVSYHFSNDGRMQTGWLELDGATYYLNPISGAMLTGMQTIDGQKYIFGDDGVLMAE